MDEYDRHIRNLGRVDFDDLIVLATIFLDDSEIRSSCRTGGHMFLKTRPMTPLLCRKSCLGS